MKSDGLTARLHIPKLQEAQGLSVVSIRIVNTDRVIIFSLPLIMRSLDKIIVRNNEPLLTHEGRYRLERFRRGLQGISKVPIEHKAECDDN